MSLLGSFSCISELSLVVTELSAHCPALLNVYHQCGPQIRFSVLAHWVCIYRHVAQGLAVYTEAPKAPVCLRTMNVNVVASQQGEEQSRDAPNKS